MAKVDVTVLEELVGRLLDEAAEEMSKAGPFGPDHDVNRSAYAQGLFHSAVRIAKLIDRAAIDWPFFTEWYTWMWARR